VGVVDSHEEGSSRPQVSRQPVQAVQQRKQVGLMYLRMLDQEAGDATCRACEHGPLLRGLETPKDPFEELPHDAEGEPPLPLSTPGSTHSKPGAASGPASRGEELGLADSRRPLDPQQPPPPSYGSRKAFIHQGQVIVSLEKLRSLASDGHLAIISDHTGKVFGRPPDALHHLAPHDHNIEMRGMEILFMTSGALSNPMSRATLQTPARSSWCSK
jgi:hypothetical protein